MGEYEQGQQRRVAGSRGREEGNQHHERDRAERGGDHRGGGHGRPGEAVALAKRLQLRSLLGQSSTVLMSTHNISEVAALCQSVYVMFSGRISFTGTPADLAAGRVWEDTTQDPRAIRSWITATGTYRHLGEPPAGAQVVDPTLDDGYLLLAREEHR